MVKILDFGLPEIHEQRVRGGQKSIHMDGLDRQKWTIEIVSSPGHVALFSKPMRMLDFYGRDLVLSTPSDRLFLPRLEIPVTISPELSSACQQCHRHICGSTFVRALFLARFCRL
jgi:hypothetical protein